MSTDSAETQRKFKAKLNAPFPFIADPDAKLVQLFGVKVPIFTYAKRRTFVIGKDRRILAIDEGSDAIDPQGALGVCAKGAEAFSTKQ